MRRTTHFRHSSDVPAYAAKEMAIIGIVPCLTLTPKGEQFIAGGQPFVSLGETTEAEFRASIAAHPEVQAGPFTLPAGTKFMRISTD